MKRYIRIAISVVLLACSVRSPLPLGGVPSERDLQKYDRAGPYTISPRDGETESKAAIREFIWDHFSKQGRGYLVATWYTKEGEPYTHHFFVEPGPNGIWHIKVTVDAIKIAGPPAGAATPHRRIHSKYVVCTIKRTDPPQKLYPESEQEVPPSSKYRLVLEYCGGGSLRI